MQPLSLLPNQPLRHMRLPAPTHLQQPAAAASQEDQLQVAPLSPAVWWDCAVQHLQVWTRAALGLNRKSLQVVICPAKHAER